MRILSAPVRALRAFEPAIGAQVLVNLLAFGDLPIVVWDERLSAAAVTCEMIAHDMCRRRRAEIVDRVAIAYIL